MNIEELTVGELAKLATVFSGNQKQTETAFEIGKPYLIRTVTMIDTGIVKSVSEHEIVLTDAAWIADTGRFSDAVESATFSEVEPFPSGEVIIGRGSIIDAVRINKSPRSKK